MTFGDMRVYVEEREARRKDMWQMAQYMAFWIVNGQRAAAGAKKMIAWKDFDPWGSEDEADKRAMKEVTDEQHMEAIRRMDERMKKFKKEPKKLKLKY
jgi:hypothetical protein